MKVIIWKLKQLPALLLNGFEEWRQYIWNTEPDDYFCCSGEECGCGGATNKEMYDSMENKRV